MALNNNEYVYPLGIDIGSTTVKIAILNEQNEIVFSDYKRHFADIQGTLAILIEEAKQELGDIKLSPMITGSGGLSLSKHLKHRHIGKQIPFRILCHQLAWLF